MKNSLIMSFIIHQCQSSASIFGTVGHFYALLCVVNPLRTAQLLLLLLMQYLVLHDSLQCTAVHAVAFVTGTLRNFCPTSSSQYFATSAMLFLSLLYIIIPHVPGADIPVT